MSDTGQNQEEWMLLPEPWTVCPELVSLIESAKSVNEAASRLRILDAAPELLAALKAAVDAGLIPEADSFPRSTQTAAGTAARMVRAAIAKAEGRDAPQ